MAKDTIKTANKASKKTGRRATPERSAEDAMAEQIMAQMGEAAMPQRPMSGSPLQRATASTQLSAGDAYGGDGSMEAQTNSAIDNLGDEAYEMDSATLLDAIGLGADPKAVAALDKLSPEERVDVLRTMGAMGDPEAAATEAVARQPQPEDEVLRAMGVE